MRSFAIILALLNPCMGQVEALQPGRETLKGIRGLFLEVDDVIQTARSNGVEERELKVACELRLRSLGVPILDRRDAADRAASIDGNINPPYLRVVPNFLCLEGDSFCAYSLRVEFWQPAALAERDMKAVTPASTWSAGIVAITGKTGLRQKVKAELLGLVDRFANDFLSVNPKR